MPLRAQLDAVATLLDEGAADSAVRMLRSSWEPELPVDDLIPLYCMWIRALCDTGDLDHACVLAERAADEFPAEPDVLIALGNVHDLRGSMQDARGAFERAIEADRGGALQHYNLGAVLERLGEEDAAETCYRQAIEAEDEGPAMYEATAAMGALLRRSGRLDEAAGIYESYLEADPINVDLVVEHGICLSDLEAFDEAIDRFTLALSIEPTHSGGLYNFAITLYRMGRYDEAISAMERAHRADPQSPLTLAVLGSWYMASPEMDLDDALSLLYGALDLLMALDDAEGVTAGYSGLVAEEVFEALWQHGRRSEAREVARVAGQHDWITPHILDTLNEADHGRGPEVTAYNVTARAQAGEAPEHWPQDAEGYTTGLTVLASDEDEARQFSLEYLRNIEPSPAVRFDVDVVAPGIPDDLSSLVGVGPRARGVVRVNGHRAYFRS